MVEQKIDKLIQESLELIEEKTYFDLSTNERRMLAAQLKELSPKERKKLRYITDKLNLAAKVGVIEGGLAALVAGLGTALAIGSGGTIPMLVAALAGIGVGGARAETTYNDATKANDLNNTIGKKEIDKLTKELEDIIGEPMTNLMKKYGKYKFTYKDFHGKTR